MEFDKITVTADWEHIVGWQDGTTAARILWKDAGGVSGRWTNRELAAVGTLRAALTRYPLVSAGLLAAVTVQDLQVAIEPGNRDAVQVVAEVKTQRCTCADEELYTVRVEASGTPAVWGPMPGTDAEISVRVNQEDNLAPRSPRSRARTPTTGRAAWVHRRRRGLCQGPSGGSESFSWPGLLPAVRPRAVGKFVIIPRANGSGRGLSPAGR